MPVSVLVLLNIDSFRVCEVMIRPLYGVGEQSKLRVRKVFFTISWLIVRLFFIRMWKKYILRDFHPLVLFYAIGLVLLLFGSGVAVQARSVTGTSFRLSTARCRWDGSSSRRSASSAASNSFCSAPGLIWTTTSPSSSPAKGRGRRRCGSAAATAQDVETAASSLAGSSRLPAALVRQRMEENPKRILAESPGMLERWCAVATALA